MFAHIRIVLTNIYTNKYLIFSEHKGLKLENEQQIQERHQGKFYLWFKEHVSKCILFFYVINILNSPT